MNLVLGPNVLDDVVGHAKACYPKEGCGFIAGRNGIGTRFIPMENMAGSETLYEMDPSALARAVVDLSGRPHLECGIPVPFHDIGNFQGDSSIDFFRAFANSCACTVHLDLLRGNNLHHGLEALFKSLALALRQAVAVRPGSKAVPSTKGKL